MVKTLRIFSTLGLFAIALSPLASWATYKKVVRPEALKHAPKSSATPGELIVKFRSGSSKDHRDQVLRSNNGKVMKTLGAHKDITRIKLSATDTVDAAIEKFRQDPNVEIAEPNYIYHIATLPNDPMVSRQWAIKNTGQTITTAGVQGATYGATSGTSGLDLGLEQAWNYITDCRAAKVGVVDSGIQYDHEDLKDNMWDGGTAYPNHGLNTVGDGTSLDPRDDNGHGTHVASIIGARGNNSVGGSGVCWQATLIAAKAGDASGSLSTSDVIEAIDFAREQKVKVMNMSFSSSENSTALRTAISEAADAGIVVVAAAGNETNDNDSKTAAYPCNYDLANIVCVAALDQNFKLAAFSNYGLKSVDVAAPGVNIIASWAGISSSLPLVAPDSAWNRGSGWGLQNLVDTTTNENVPVLSNPADWPNGAYANKLNSSAWRSYAAGSGLLSQTLSMTADVTLSANDHFEIAVGTGNQDPFVSASGTLLDEFADEKTATQLTYDLSPYKATQFSIGTKMITDSSTTNVGVGLYDFSLDRLVLSNSTYQIEQGTSMAAPYVTGVVAMLYAFNPDFTVADIVEALDQGGVAVPSLAAKIRTGKAVNAMGALAHIRAPSGVRATVAP